MVIAHSLQITHFYLALFNISIFFALKSILVNFKHRFFAEQKNFCSHKSLKISMIFSFVFTTLKQENKKTFQTKLTHKQNFPVRLCTYNIFTFFVLRKQKFHSILIFRNKIYIKKYTKTYYAYLFKLKAHWFLSVTDKSFSSFNFVIHNIFENSEPLLYHFKCS